MDTPRNPYETYPPRAFWRQAVGQLEAEEISELWTPKFQITHDMPIVTAGSCFAQHFGRALADRGYGWLDCEPAPPMLRKEQAKAYNFGIFSTRTQNIYTTRMLRQWLEAAFGIRPVVDEIWEADGRFFDPIRPTVEPGGFASEAELRQARENTYAALRRAVTEAGVFVFTMGLTESWANAESGLEYASCPGTAAGVYDPAQHVFVNHRFDAISEDLSASLSLLHDKNPTLRVLLTVSPVPLTATASSQHVLTATSYSKSVLRAVAGAAAEDHDFVDYFPSYEIITAPPYGGRFFAENQRSVLPEGVAFVMKNFFEAQAAAFGASTPKRSQSKKKKSAARVRAASDDVRCEEAMLDAFARK